MARPHRIRKVNNPPHFKGFRPIGLSDEKPVVLNLEEYEALRLSDFENLGQVEAAKTMNVSRPTYARIYETARRKVAQAFVLGKAIVFEGGKVYFDSQWYSCNACGCWFNHPEKNQAVNNCPLCGSTHIEQYHDDASMNEGADICICPQCGTQSNQSDASPCKKEFCPDCNCQMVHQGNSHRRFSKNKQCCKH